MSAVDGQAAGVRVHGGESPPQAPIEVWSWLAFGMLALAVGGIVYLGARPGGIGPIWFWLHGRFLLVGAAFFLTLVGLAWSARYPPFLQRRRGRAFLSLVLVVGVLPLPMPYPSSRERSPSRVPFVLPLEGTWVVHQSGTAGGPLSAMTADRRFGLHFVHPDDLAPEVAGEHASEYAGYGATVLAPAPGVVAWVRDGLPDRSLAESAYGDMPELGNVIVLEVAEDQYLFFGHLAAGSLRVAVGDTVVVDQALGQVGFSGRFRFTPMPNLSLHLQSAPDEGWGEPIPWTFRDYVGGVTAVPNGVPAQGQSVRRDG